MREKLAHVQRKARVLKRDVAALDAVLAGRRDRVTRAKAARDRRASQARRVAEAAVHVARPELLADMRAQARDPSPSCPPCCADAHCRGRDPGPAGVVAVVPASWEGRDGPNRP